MKIKLAIFDLGKVLIDFDLQKVLMAWAKSSGATESDILKKFSLDYAFEQFERGEIPKEEYFKHLELTLGISMKAEQWEEGWNALWGSVNDATYQVILRLKEHMPVVCLSNTNESHYKVWTERYKNHLDGFDKIYASSEIGMRKPEKRAFAHIIEEYHVGYNEVIFFDDLEENINAAKGLGINTVLVENEKSVSDWAESMTAFTQ